MLDLKSRSESLISGDQWPFLVLFLLFLLPYMLYTPSILFPIRNAIDNSEHIFYSFFFAILLYFSVSFGNFLGVSIVDIFGFDSFRSDHPNAVYLALLYFLLYLCIAAHIYLIVVGGSGYTEGGFLEARESFITKGIGIPLRLYMIVVPLILANGAYSGLCSCLYSSVYFK